VLLLFLALCVRVRARARKDAAAQSPAMHQHTAKLRCIECSLNSIVLFAKQFKKVGLLMP
jgi:cytochrome c-type biogenesis protein CcmH/NrfF